MYTNTEHCERILINEYIDNFSGTSCPFGNADEFDVTFQNNDIHPIDIKLYDQEGNIKVMKSKLMPGAEKTFTTYFTHEWIFTRSDTVKQLKANRGKITSQIFEGCHFKADVNERITVFISEGKGKVKDTLDNALGSLVS